MTRQQKFRDDVMAELSRIQDVQKTRGEKPLELSIQHWEFIIGVAAEFAERGFAEGYDDRAKQERTK
jgi:hypothetical protein